MTEIRDSDARLLALLQAQFPLTARPWEVLGRRLGMTGRQVIQRVKALRREGVIRHIGGMFDSQSLGYHGVLAAMKCPKERIDEIAATVSKHPGVTHNYARTHSFNLWFTISVPPGHDVQKEVDRLAQRAKPRQTIVLPSLRQFKLRLVLPVSGTVGPTALRGRPARSSNVILPSAPRLQAEGSGAKNLHPGETARCFAEFTLSQAEGLRMTGGARVPRLSTADAAAIRELQKDLPASERPFLAAARRAGVSEEAILRRARSLMRRRVMRRFGAILHHRRAGFVANCMAVWAVPRSRIERAGTIAAQSPAVSHCYQRSAAKGWPYTLFAMIHGHSKTECRGIADQISARIGHPKRALLFSTKEYKKTHPVYVPQVWLP